VPQGVKSDFRFGAKPFLTLRPCYSHFRPSYRNSSLLPVGSRTAFVIHNTKNDNTQVILLDDDVSPHQ